MQARNSGFANVRRLAAILIIGLLLLAAQPALPEAAASCAREDFAKAVNDAGAALRRLNAENAPRLDAKMRHVRTKMRWPESGYEEMARQALHDERVAALDTAANELLAKIDTLGTVDTPSMPDCSKLAELSAANLELQATVKTKTAYLLSKLDQMLGEPVPAPKSESKTTSAPKAEPKTPPAPKAMLEPGPLAAGKTPTASGWSTKTAGQPPPDAAVEPPTIPSGPPPAVVEEEGYTIDEIRAVSAGFFGQVSANLASAIEHAFSKGGRPTAYILGTEGGGAFLAGVRYGKGLLYLRAGGSKGLRIFWHGPTLGADVGGEGSKTLFLIYKLKEPEELYTSFTGVAGSAYLVGGVGFTLVTNGTVVMAPIRSGLGLRLGASIGYIRFTPKATWNPF
jgi:hypothetical protein